MGRTVRFRGDRWTYTELAAHRYLDEPIEPVTCDGYRETIQGLRDGDLAILPIENTVNGSYVQISDLFIEMHPWIVGETVVGFDHALIGHPGTRLDEIERVITRPEVRNQCRDLFRDHDLTWEASRTTASGVARAKERHGPEVAAIGPPEAAKHHGMEIVRRSVQDHDAVLTRFVVVTRFQQPVPEEADKTTVSFVTPHEPGALADVLDVFGDRGIDVQRLDCRPIPDRPWHYAFQADLDGSALDAPLQRALQEAGRRSLEFRLAGSYPSAPEEE